jgi:cytochrome d ubiquinol oxidase subunit II
MLNELPLIFILIGIAAYAVLAGADFGAGIWILLSRRRDTALREHARHAMGPVWEANHVWLIFVIVVAWTAYPSVLASIASTLAIPLTVAAIGIILRGTAYALRAQLEHGELAIQTERLLGASSILTPFALGAVVGAIASGRVPPGNAAGDLWSSWLNATGITIGLLSVATSWYLASVYLAADAARIGDAEVGRAFRERALAVGVGAGALAFAALIVVHEDARPIWDGLTSGWGLVPLICSAIAGAATLLLVGARRYEPARFAAATAVAAVVAGWAVAQSPYMLPGVTVDEAAAGHSTLVAIVIAVVAGALILFPSLAVLFNLQLAGRFDPGRATVEPSVEPRRAPPPARIALAVALFVVGAGLMLVSDATLPLGLGLVAVLAFVLLAFAPLAAPPDEPLRKPER